MPPYHQHLIVRAEVAQPYVDTELTAHWLEVLIDRINMKKLAGPLVKYCEVPGNRGLTAVVIIETSHIAMHIWDEVNPALVQLDVYTCSYLPIPEVLDHLQVMAPTKLEYKFLDREHDLTFIEVLQTSSL